MRHSGVKIKQSKNGWLELMSRRWIGDSSAALWTIPRGMHIPAPDRPSCHLGNSCTCAKCLGAYKIEKNVKQGKIHLRCAWISISRMSWCSTFPLTSCDLNRIWRMTNWGLGFYIIFKPACLKCHWNFALPIARQINISKFSFTKRPSYVEIGKAPILFT